MSFPGVTLVSLSGIPGVGKSRARKRLAKTKFLEEALDIDPSELEVVFVAEPVKLWKEKGYLQEFYKNPSLYALPFQLIVFDTHVEAVEKAIASKTKPHMLIVVERCMFDQLLFWKQQVDLKQETAGPMFDAAYTRIWSRWNKFVPPVSVIFFFHTSDIQMTMKRMQARARAEETGLGASIDPSTGDVQEVNGLTLGYQATLLLKHYTWFTEPYASCGDGTIPCVRINVDAPYHVDDDALRALAQKLATHIIILSLKK